MLSKVLPSSGRGLFNSHHHHGASCPSGFGRRALVCPWVRGSPWTAERQTVCPPALSRLTCRLRSRSIMMCRCNALLL